jgi:hypothetical protein
VLCSHIQVWLAKWRATPSCGAQLTSSCNYLPAPRENDPGSDCCAQVKEMERHGSLKGSDSVQFQQYMEFQRKSLTKQEETLERDLPKKGSETAKSGTGNLIRSGAKK